MCTSPVKLTASSKSPNASVNLFGSGCLHSYPRCAANDFRSTALAVSSARFVVSDSRSGAERLTKHTATGRFGSGLWRYPGVNAFAVLKRGVELCIPRNVLTSS